MNRKFLDEILIALFPMTSVLLTAALYGIMPDLIPATFNLRGGVSAFTDKSFIVFIISMLSLFFYLYFLIVPHIDKKSIYVRFNNAYRMMRLIVSVTLFLINSAYLLVIFYPHRMELFIAVKVILSVALMFIGDRLPKVKRNYFIGVVNPWTLRNAAVWSKTQRFTGRLVFYTSIIMLLLSFINLEWSNAVYFALIVFMIFVPHLYAAKAYFNKTINSDRR